MRELPKITSAMLVVTHGCNLRCRYCFVQKEPQRMALSTAKDAARFLMANAVASGGGTPEINFFGGEPMLEFDTVIKPLVEWVHDELGKPFRFSITTNGTLLTDERIRFMQRHGFGLLLSMDGNAPVQDYNRPCADGKGSFTILKPIVPKVLAAWPGTTFRMTAIPETCSHLFESIMWASAQGFTNFFVTPNVFEAWDDAARDVLAGELRKYADYYADCKARGVRPITFSTFEQAFQDMKQIELAEKQGAYRAMPKCRSEGKCGLGTSRFASIHPNGNLYACQEMTSNEGEESAFYIGSIYSGVDNNRRRALAESFDSVPVRGEYCSGSPQKRSFCGERRSDGTTEPSRSRGGEGCAVRDDVCEYDRICDGGCVANNYMVTGRLGRMPEMYCWWRRTVLHEAMRVKEAEQCRAEA